jgi:hypothetical protein
MNLVITPEKRNPANPPRRYRFEARLEGEGRLLCVSHQPFVDAARVLVDEGYDLTEILTMRHVGSETIALTAQLGAAAKCMVEEGPGDGPRFVQYAPWSSDPAVKQPAACRTYAATRQKSEKPSQEDGAPGVALPGAETREEIYWPKSLKLPASGRAVKKRQTANHLIGDERAAAGFDEAGTDEVGNVGPR